MKEKLQILIVLGLLFSSSLFAQKNCMNTLREAKELYEQGLINEIPELLSDCMESGFTRAQRIEAYKLIILAYLFDDDQFAAEKTMDEFLRKFPEYEIMPNDPVEFVYLLESYQTSSFYSLNFSFGPTFSNQRVLMPYSVSDRNRTTYSDQTGTGYQFQFGVSRNFWKDFNSSIGIIFSQNNYAQTEITRTLVGTREVTFSELSVKEELTKIDLPLTFSYRFGRGNLNYSLRAGGMVSFITKGRLSPVRSQPGIDDLSSEFNIRPFRTNQYFSLVAGAGMEYKVPRGFLVLDMRYNYGLQNIVRDDMRYSMPELYSRYFYIDDDFSLTYISVTLGYHFRIYQSKRNKF